MPDWILPFASENTGTALIAVVLWFMRSSQNRLDDDLRAHMADETEHRNDNDKQWLAHVTGHAPSGGSN